MAVTQEHASQVYCIGIVGVCVAICISLNYSELQCQAFCWFLTIELWERGVFGRRPCVRVRVCPHARV